MMREKADFDILGKILTERKTRNWSEYTLSQKTGLSQSTISTWYHRDLQPSVASIEKICKGLGITLSQFFADYQSGQPVILNEEQKQILGYWERLNAEQKTALLNLLCAFLSESEAD